MHAFVREFLLPQLSQRLVGQRTAVSPPLISILDTCAHSLSGMLRRLPYNLDRRTDLSWRMLRRDVWTD